ncbi:MAG: esterase-like activity of phytase family protein, partial [Streptosporangiaceae bacterium]
DGKTLVGVMQSALQQTDLATTNAKNQTPVRIVTVDLAGGKTHEYLFLLDNPKALGTAVSEITAISDHEFLIDERDGGFVSATSYKKLWKVDLAGATDVGPAHPDYTPGAGVLVNGRSIELTVKALDTAPSRAALVAAGITPVTQSVHLDVARLLLRLDPQARFFSHDKIEGVAYVDGRIVLANDSDFGIGGVTGTTAPFTLAPKVSPFTGLVDDGEFLEIDPSKSATPATATVTVRVR